MVCFFHIILWFKMKIHKSSWKSIDNAEIIEIFHALMKCIINIRLNYSFGPFICHKISLWSSSFSLSQFSPHFLKNDSIWSSPLTLTKRC